MSQTFILGLKMHARAVRASADCFVWTDPKPDGSPPNNWLSIFGGSAWTWNPTRRQYYLHNFLESQPDLNFHNPRVRQEVLSIAKFWLTAASVDSDSTPSTSTITTPSYAVIHRRRPVTRPWLIRAIHMVTRITSMTRTVLRSLSS